jgi:spore germination protein YaaH
MFFLIIFIIIFVHKLFSDEYSFSNIEEVTVYFDGIKDSEYEHYYINNQIYISADYLMKNKIIDFYWDKEYEKISIFNNYNYEAINYNDNKAFYNNAPHNRDDIFVVESDNLFFNINFIKDNYENRIYIDNDNLKVIIERNIRKYEFVKKSRIKTNYSNISKTLKKTDVGEIIYIYDYEINGWVLSRTEDNVIGFVNLSHIKPVSNTKIVSYPTFDKNKEIKMAWDLLYRPILEFEPFMLPDSIDIIAPTWFDLKDDEKEFFADISNDDYINYVQASNKSIWGVFSNSFDPDLTNKLLHNGEKRSKILDEIINITKAKGLDGINIDFENIYLKDKDVFSAFVKELYCKARAANIIMSVDITILSNSENWSLCYDRNVIGEYTDYIMLMAYDENVSTIGSVSSIPWVEYGVQNILEYTYSGKVVLSIPFYTRLWEVNENNELIKTTALRIETAKNVIEELGMHLTFDDLTKQNYGKVTIDGITYIIWNEDETSLKKRIEIANNYNLAGVSVWALSYGVEEMWSLIDLK